MRARPSEDIGNLIPIGHIFKLHRLNRCTRDNHTIEFFFAHRLKITIEHHHVFYGRVFGGVTLQLHETDFHLKRSVRKQTNQVCLSGDFKRHQIQNHDFQRTDTWVVALELSITNIFSFLRMSIAGSLSGNLKGIAFKV